MICNERPFEWYIMWQYFKKVFSSGQGWRNNVLHLTSKFIFLTYWSHDVLIKIDLHTKSNLITFEYASKKMNFGGSLLSIFSYHEAKENVKYFFSAWFSDHGLLVKNDQQWKTFRMMYNMAMFERKKISLINSYDVKTFCIWRVILFSLHFEAILFY